MLTIDGSQGEGGGQVLRTALTLSMITGTPFRIENVRAGREKPGLLRQHLTCVDAAARISSAKVEGAALGSRALTFAPQTIQGGTYDFAVGSAGSTALVFQTILLPLLAAKEPSRVTLSGGTHNPSAPTFDYLEGVYLPLLARMGANATLTFERHGFYPAGGGRWRAAITPSGPLKSITLDEPGPLKRRHIMAMVANLPFNVAEREAETARALLNWPRETTLARSVQADGPGNALIIEVRHELVTEQFTGLGSRGIAAETVAKVLAREVKDFVASAVPVGPHLADQLLLPMALAGAGSFVTVPLHEHTKTNVAVIEKFLPIEFRIEEQATGRWRLSVSS